jgi:hypothetical protein
MRATTSASAVSSGGETRLDRSDDRLCDVGPFDVVALRDRGEVRRDEHADHAIDREQPGRERGYVLGWRRVEVCGDSRLHDDPTQHPLDAVGIRCAFRVHTKAQIRSALAGHLGIPPSSS